MTAAHLSAAAACEPAQMPRAARWLVPGAVLMVLTLQFSLVLTRAVNWDEFWHYSLTVLAARGQLDQPLQTAFTRPFMWVTALPGSSIDQIIIIRLFMLACELATLGAIIAIATRFSDRTTGWLCALAYLCAAYVLQHGTSYRFDPPATALMMGSLWVLTCRPFDQRAMILAGALAGLGTIVTIKAVLYAPVFAGVLWLRWREDGQTTGAIALRIATLGASAAVVFGVCYGLHAQGIVAIKGGSSGDTINASAAKMFSLTEHPYWRHNLKGAVLSPVLCMLILAAAAMLATARMPAPRRIALGGFLLPVLMPLFYHNTAPYFHVFMLAPVAVALAVAIPSVTRRYGVPALTAALVLGAGFVMAREQPGPIASQRAIIAAAETIFPEPVAYFDSCAMIGKFRKANAFMTPWGTERYLRGETASLIEAQARQAVPLVVENDPIFSAALRTTGPVPELRSDDLAMLRATYVPLWGPFWIAGFELPQAPVATTITVRVPGTYTVAAGAGLDVDGRAYRGGEIVRLARGPHSIAPHREPARLIWGDHLNAPATAPPPEPYFTSF